MPVSFVHAHTMTDFLNYVIFQCENRKRLNICTVVMETWLLTQVLDSPSHQLAAVTIEPSSLEVKNLDCVMN